MTELAAQLGIDPTLKKKKKKTIKLDDLDAIVSTKHRKQTAGSKGHFSSYLRVRFKPQKSVLDLVFNNIH